MATGFRLSTPARPRRRAHLGMISLPLIMAGMFPDGPLLIEICAINTGSIEHQFFNSLSGESPEGQHRGAAPPVGTYRFPDKSDA